MMNAVQFISLAQIRQKAAPIYIAKMQY